MVAIYDVPDLYDRLVPPAPCELFYRRLAPRRGATILELACGTGWLTIPLAKDGHEVVGLDASQPMLEKARKKAQAAGVKVQWIMGDMAKFDLDRRFDLIVMTCNSLAHLTAERALASCLEKIRMHLSSEGVFAFDIVNPRLRTLLRPKKARVRRAHSSRQLRVREEVSYDPESRISEVKWRVEDKDGAVHEVEIPRLRQISSDELIHLLSATGFMLIARHGDFDRRKFHAKSRNQICIARPQP